MTSDDEWEWERQQLEKKIEKLERIVEDLEEDLITKDAYINTLIVPIDGHLLAQMNNTIDIVTILR